MGTAQYDSRGRELVPGLAFADGPAEDAAGRLRVSNPVALWDTQFEYNLHPLYYHQTTATNGTITHVAAHSEAALNVATDSGSTAILQSYEYFRFEPGKSQQVMLTYLLAAATTNMDQRVGYFDAENGFFLERTDSTINFVRRTKTSGSVVNNKTAQAAWNLDVFDGSGPSGITLDHTKIQKLIIDFTPMGRVRYGFEIDGVLFYAHQERIANTLDVPATVTANLPLRWEIINTGIIAGARTLEAYAASITSEGGQELQTAHPFEFGREGATAADGVEEAFIGIRPATTLNSITFRGKITPLVLNLVVSGSDCHWHIRYAPTTLTDVSFQAPVTHSAVQTDIATTAIAGGILIGGGFIAAGQGQRSVAGGEILRGRLPLTLNPDGTQTISVFVTIEGVGGTTTVSGSISWEEIR